MNLSQEEINNILGLINVAPITGKEATTVALLQQKLLALAQHNEASKQQDTPKQDRRRI
jgi:hypothetical protein